MKGYSIFKAKKLIKISLEHDGKRVQSIKIHGDFFFYPEEKLSDLEKNLEGTELTAVALSARIRGFLLGGASAFGFDENELSTAILQAAQEGSVP